MKYLDAFLGTTNSEYVQRDLPTEPTKPPRSDAGGRRSETDISLNSRTYETYETPAPPPRPIFGRSDWAHLSTLRWGESIDDPTPGIDFEPPPAPPSAPVPWSDPEGIIVMVSGPPGDADAFWRQEARRDWRPERGSGRW